MYIFLKKLIVRISLSLLFYQIIFPISTQGTTLNQNLPQLTKQQMIEDVNYLIKTVKESYPKLSVTKEVYNIDIIKILESYRDNITGKETIEQFINLIYEATQKCKADHFFISDGSEYKRFKCWFNNLVSKEDYQISKQYLKRSKHNDAQKKQIQFPFYYKNNNMYTKCTIVVNNKNTLQN